MKVIARAAIDGPEARGNAEILHLEDGTFQLHLHDFWVAPGAPDVRVVLSPQLNGQPDDSMIEVAPYEYGSNEHSYSLPGGIALQEMKTIIIYCKQFTVHFGHGVLEQIN